MEKILVSGAGVQSRTLGFQGKNLQDRAVEVVDVADGLANSGRQEDEVRGRQAGADNLPREIAMNILALHLSKLRTSHIQISSNRLGNCRGRRWGKIYLALEQITWRKLQKAVLSS